MTADSGERRAVMNGYSLSLGGGRGSLLIRSPSLSPSYSRRIPEHGGDKTSNIINCGFYCRKSCFEFFVRTLVRSWTGLF